MPEHPIETSRRAEWERVRKTGLWPYAIRRGLLRGIPMGIVIIVALEWIQGRPVGGSFLRDAGTWGRLALAVVLFSLGGMFSAYARWRALDLRYGAARGED